jgi:ABC-2 type transport system permease protein
MSRSKEVRTVFRPPVDIEERVRYNPNLSRRSFGAVAALIDQITMPSVLLTAALIREREVFPLSQFASRRTVTPSSYPIGRLW